MHPFRLVRTALVAVLLAAAGTVSAATPEILAFVGEDTLTTIDLRIELNLMEKRNEGAQPLEMPEPAAALRRLVENRLVVQEGYRMGLDQEFTVRNQVDEAVNARCMGALLDSVALATPPGAADLQEARRQAVRKYIADLTVRFAVEVDSTLLRSLDYGSKDPAMQQRLRDSQEVLAVVPTGKLTVAAFSRIIRFTAFHGLEGKPDAAVRRDQIFHEWLAEAVTHFEARRQDIRRRPEIRLYEMRLERTLMLEETLKVLLDFPFAPGDDEIAAFHAAHLAEFMKPAEVRMESLKFGTQAAAAAARARLQEGARLSWIQHNMDQVVEGPPPFPNEFFEAGKLALKPAEAVVGWIPEPYGVPGGWVLARVVEVRAPQPIPVADCRDKLVGMMRAEATGRHMQEIIRRLEAAVPVRVQPDAEEIVRRTLAQADAGK